ncbi:MAG: hypothetical protein NTW25_02895 [Candidatus Kapabacteria bacterium]|nr:hypothetical protein [Candidatus Kapabacteria bacterium]
MSKSILIFVLLSLMNISIMFSQNSGWQNSSRMPFETPKLFFGGGLEYSSYLHKGDFRFIEKNTPCCGYGNGSGSGFALGLKALYSGVSYKNQNAVFKSQTSYPKSPLINIVTEFQYTGELNYLTLETGIRKSILFENLSISGLLSLDILLNNNSNHIERIISPSNVPFNDGSYERIISNGKIADLKKYILAPKISMNYDIDLGNVSFLTMNTYIAVPIQNTLNNEEWKALGFGFGLVFYKGMPK